MTQIENKHFLLHSLQENKLDKTYYYINVLNSIIYINIYIYYIYIYICIYKIEHIIK